MIVSAYHPGRELVFPSHPDKKILGPESNRLKPHLNDHPLAVKLFFRENSSNHPKCSILSQPAGYKKAILERLSSICTPSSVQSQKFIFKKRQRL